MVGGGGGGRGVLGRGVVLFSVLALRVWVETAVEAWL